MRMIGLDYCMLLSMIDYAVLRWNESGNEFPISTMEGIDLCTLETSRWSSASPAFLLAAHRPMQGARWNLPSPSNTLASLWFSCLHASTTGPHFIDS